MSEVEEVSAAGSSEAAAASELEEASLAGELSVFPLPPLQALRRTTAIPALAAARNGLGSFIGPPSVVTDLVEHSQAQPSHQFRNAKHFYAHMGDHTGPQLVLPGGLASLTFPLSTRTQGVLGNESTNSGVPAI